MDERSVDLLFLAWNRREFTEESFRTLLRNTDWKFVNKLFVIDDGSTDGTLEFLERAIREVPANHELLRTRFGNSCTATNHFIEVSTAPLLAKLDNDTIYPPGWLRQSLAVYDKHPELDMLGLEAFYEVADGDVDRSYARCPYVSGLALYRRACFEKFGMPTPHETWFGLEEWMESNPQIVCGWIRPSIPTILLDRIPFQPWAGYAEKYQQWGWQRTWKKYHHKSTLYRWRWPEEGGDIPHQPPDYVPPDPSAVMLDASGFGQWGHGTHQPALIGAVAAARPGPVVEYGAGHYSTPLLHALCAASGRTLLTIDHDRAWLDKFESLRSPEHSLVFAEDWDRVLPVVASTPWAVVFIDHAPADRRVVEIARLARRCEFMVVHDTEHSVYGYESVFKKEFQYRYDYKRLHPWTTILSNLRRFPAEL